MPEALALGATVDVSAALQTFMAFDFGTRRTGVAFGNRLLRSASALPTLTVQGEACLHQIQSRLTEWQPSALVVGIPFHPDGAAHEMTHRARKFARTLRTRFKLPVFEVDERYSTTEALTNGAADPDAGAACIILEQFLWGLS